MMTWNGLIYFESFHVNSYKILHIIYIHMYEIIKYEGRK